MPSPFSLLVAGLMAPAAMTWCKLMLDNPGERIIRAWVGAAQRQAAHALWPMGFEGNSCSAARLPSPFARSDTPVVTSAIVYAFPTPPRRLEQPTQHVAPGE
jgi:hypothetical protein